MIYQEAKTAVCTNFNQDYFSMNLLINRIGRHIESRVGPTKELLSFKTVINNPVQRCVGGYGRNMNVFFLLAEALWIFAGRRDLKFLEIFNGGMREFSDDGINFHAPYGWRLRRWGLTSVNDKDDESLHAGCNGVTIDQLKVGLKMLEANGEDRRIVLSIWNPYFDLFKVSKDLPCNDLLMFIVRNNEYNKPSLYLDIANRSNDLNLGLATNVFQFSFMLEAMAAILGIEVGQQVHNSRSLHIYTQQEVTDRLLRNIVEDAVRNNMPSNLYHDANVLLMDFNFEAEGAHTAIDKLNTLDTYIKNMIFHLIDYNEKYNEGVELKHSFEFSETLLKFSKYLHMVYQLLTVYIRYKKQKDKLKALQGLHLLPFVYDHIKSDNDLYVMALNFFLARMKQDYSFSEFEDFKISFFRQNNETIPHSQRRLINNLGRY